MVTKIDASTAKFIKGRVANALQEVEREFGIKFGIDNMRFSTGSIAMTINGVNDVPLEETQAGNLFKIYAPRAGLDADMLGKTFYANGVAYKITGWKPSRPKYPIETLRVRDNRPYKFSIRQIEVFAPTARAA